MATHNLTPDEVQSIVRDHLQPEVVPEALAALEANGYYMTADLPRPTSELLADVLRSATGRTVGHIATPPENPFDVYYLSGDERIDLDDIHRLAAEMSARVINAMK